MDTMDAKSAGKFLYESGLLFEINRRILHPLGLAIAVMLPDDGSVVLSDMLWDYRNDPEGLLFAEDTFVEGKAKYDKFMAEEGMQKLEERMKVLGFVEQEEP